MSAKKNILYSSLSSEITGGGQKSLLLILKALDRNKFTPVLLLPGEGVMAELAKNAGIVVEFLDFPPLRIFNLSKIIQGIQKAKRIVKDRGIDLVHSDSPRSAFYLGLVAKMSRVPLAWHVRVAYSQNKIFENILYNLSTIIIAVSEASAERFKYFKGANDKLITIYNAVDPQESGQVVDRNALRLRFDIKDSDIVIGYIGQLIPKKGIESLFLALRHLAEKNKDIKLLIAGRGNIDFEKILRDKISVLGLKDLVKFCGFCNNAFEFMSAVDILALPTLYKEGCPRSILEAMAASKPVIATSLGGNKELVIDGATGILVSPLDSKELAAAILKLAEDKALRESMGKAAKESAEEKFTLTRMISNLEEAYERLLR